MLKANDTYVLDGADEPKGWAVRATPCSWGLPPPWHVLGLPWEKRHRSSAAHLRGEQSAEREDNKLVGADLQRIQGSLQGPLGQDRIAQIAKTSE